MAFYRSSKGWSSTKRGKFRYRRGDNRRSQERFGEEILER